MEPPADAMNAEGAAREFKRRRFGIVAIAGILLVAAAAGLFFLIRHFPFRRELVFSRIENATGARVEVAAFREKWFPPGFTVEGVRVNGDNGAVLTIRTVTLTGSYTGLLHRPPLLKYVHAFGVHLAIPSLHQILPRKLSHTSVAVGEIRFEDSELDLLPKEPGKPPLTFMIRDLDLKHVSPGIPVAFHVSLHNPKPSGEVRSDGQFGPVNIGHPGATPVSGKFTFQHADLTVQHGISGTLNGQGSFKGRLASIECAGTAEVPDFQVFGSSHTVDLATQFQATVDATNGNVKLNQATSHFEDTTVSATGTVMSAADRPGKTVTIDMTAREARVEDLLLLFTQGSTPAMKGPISLRGKFTIPPGPPDFLTRLRIDGSFEIGRGYFSNPKTQTPINRLSASAAGESKREAEYNASLATADIRGAVTDRNGIAALRDVVFEAPGIRGRLNGRFALHDRAIDMSGTLETAGKLSDTTDSVVKTLMLKALGPLWRRRMRVQSVPFHIGGKASHPLFRLRLHSSAR